MAPPGSSMGEKWEKVTFVIKVPIKTGIARSNQYIGNTNVNIINLISTALALK